MTTLLAPAPRDVHADLTRRGVLGGGLGVSVAFLVGCGPTAPVTDNANASHTVTDFLGSTTIPVRPARVVADSVSVYAHLFALGVRPVGAALPTGISTGYFAPTNDQIANVVADDGWTIDLEEALRLRPDLIVAVGADYNEEHCRRYRAAMATYCFEEGYRDAAEVKAKFLGLGRAIGREREADDAIAAYDRKVASARSVLAPVLARTGPVGVVRFDATGFIGVRSGDIHQTVFGSIGLSEPTWPAVGASGYVELSPETLEVLNRATTLFVTTDDDVDPTAMDIFKSPLWTRLAAVAAGRAHFVGAWNGSDLLQLTRMIDDVVAALAGGTPSATRG